jgi:HSP20 family protein
MLAKRTADAATKQRKDRSNPMADIQVKKNGPQQPAPMAAPTATWDPSRWFTRMMGWDPFREMTPFSAEERLTTFAPAFEVKETTDAYQFKADVPGIKEADIDVSVTGNRLTITGKRDAEKEDKNDTYYTYERSYGSFTRTFTLPEGVDAAAVRADLKDGVLAISVPKKPEAQAKRIPVSTEQKKS